MPIKCYIHCIYTENNIYFLKYFFQYIYIYLTIVNPFNLLYIKYAMDIIPYRHMEQVNATKFPPINLDNFNDDKFYNANNI